MTPEESRANFIESQFIEKELELLKERGLYRDCVDGSISINTIYAQMWEKGI